MGCRDLEDPRTPCTHKVRVKFVPQQEGQLKLRAITNQATGIGEKLTASASQEFALDTNADATTFVIEYGSDKRATLTLHYKRIASLISPQCGAQHAFVLTDAEINPGKATITEKQLLHYSRDAKPRETNVQILL